LTSISDVLYVGGGFSDAGGVPNTNKIAGWNGTDWFALGNGTNDFVRAFATIGSDLYVGGLFTKWNNHSDTFNRISKLSDFCATPAPTPTGQQTTTQAPQTTTTTSESTSDQTSDAHTIVVDFCFGIAVAILMVILLGI